MQVSRPNIAHAPRPWLSRQPGECPFPVDGEGAAVRSCCNPIGPAGYCPAHEAIMRGAPVSDAAIFETGVIAWLGARR